MFHFLIEEQAFPWTLSIEPWAEVYEVEAGHQVVIEVRPSAEEHGGAVIEMNWPSADRKLLELGVRNTEFTVEIFAPPSPQDA